MPLLFLTLFSVVLKRLAEVEHCWPCVAVQKMQGKERMKFTLSSQDPGALISVADSGSLPTYVSDIFRTKEEDLQDCLAFFVAV